MTSKDKGKGISLAKVCAILGGAGISLCAIVLLAGTVYLLGARGEVNEFASELREGSWPTTIEELNDWYVEPPRKENAALLYIEAAGLLVSDARAPGLYWPLGSPVPVVALFAVNDYVTANAPAIGKAREAMALPSARYPIDYSGGHGVPYTASVDEPDWMWQTRALVHLLMLEATAHAENHNADAAVESLRNAFHVVRSLRDAPTLAAGFVKVSEYYTATLGVERLLSRVDLTEKQLATLDDAAAGAFDPRSMERAWAGELALVLESPRRMAAFRRDGDWRQYLTFLKRLIEASSQSPEAVIATINEIDNETDDLELGPVVAPMRSITTPGIFRAAQLFLESATRHRATRIGLAVEKYRARHGQLPETLDDLLPDFLTSIPETIFGGEPFEYTIWGSGYTVQGPSYAPGDARIVFTVARVARVGEV